MFKKSLAGLALVAALAGCASSPSGQAKSIEATPSTAAFPVTISNNGASLTLQAAPTAIISLSPTATEMLFAIGAGPQVVAVDSLSNFPADAPITDISAFEPNVEAIVAKQPDLVVLSNDMNDVVAGLTAAKVPVLLEPAAATLDDTYQQLRELGLATGQSAGAEAAVAKMKADIQTQLDRVSGQLASKSYYYELDPTFYSVTSDTFVGQILTLVGLSSIADAASDAQSGYPQLSAEFILKANPDFVFLADTKCCSASATELAARPGLSSLGAISSGRVIALDDDIASRWGPRSVQILSAAVDALTK